MNWDFDNDRPIYIQLIEKFKMLIISGMYKKGEKLPPVRELALECKVNPNTVQKALTELETYGIVYTQRTSGKFVTDDEELIKKMKAEIASEKIGEFLDYMLLLGFNKDDVINHLKNIERSF